MIYEQNKFAKLKNGEIVEIDSEGPCGEIIWDDNKKDFVEVPDVHYMYHIAGTRAMIDKKEIEKIANRREDLQ